MNDRRGVARLDIRNDQKAAGKAALCVRQREIFLVLLHRQDKAFLRYGEKCGVEAACVNDRPFGERRHFIDVAQPESVIASGILDESCVWYSPCQITPCLDRRQEVALAMQHQRWNLNGRQGRSDVDLSVQESERLDRTRTCGQPFHLRK